jgi:hypothetical protein
VWKIGQLVIVLAAVPILMVMSKQSWGGQVKIGISVAVALFGIGWFVERAFGLGFMPI